MHSTKIYKWQQIKNNKSKVKVENEIMNYVTLRSCWLKARSVINDDDNDDTPNYDCSLAHTSGPDTRVTGTHWPTSFFGRPARESGAHWPFHQKITPWHRPRPGDRLVCTELYLNHRTCMNCARPSICLSVHQRLKLGSCNFHHTVAQSL